MRRFFSRIAAMFFFVGAAASSGWAQPFFPPGALNPGAATDSGVDVNISHVIGSNGVFHAVWASTDNYTGTAGTDLDIYYSSNSGAGWSAPILVNNYGTTDSGADTMPKLAIDATGVLHCVWQSTSAYAGAGTDRDIFYSRKVGATWSAAEFVNDAFLDNLNPSNDDSLPGMAIGLDGRVVVAWSSTYPSPSGGPGAGVGTDGDILYAVRTGGGWTPPAPLTNHFASDTGADDGPVAMTTTADGDILAAWSCSDPLAPFNGKGNDYDIVWSMLPAGGAWGDPLEASALARSDTQTDSWPSIASIGSVPNREIHIVWQSQENLAGSGNDWDIFHTVIGSIAVIPPMNDTYLVNTTAKTDGPADDDNCPSLCVEPGGVLHCVWQSNHNLGGLTGTDIDVFHSLNASRGGEWSAMELLGLNGYFDAAGENDEMPSMAITPDGFLSAVWQSTDDYGGTIGADYDILNAVGDSKRFSRPDWVNSSAPNDNPAGGADFDKEVRFAVDPNGVLHAVFSSTYAGLAGGQAGTDGDIYHATLGATGWSNPQLVNTNGTADVGADIVPDIAIDAFGKLYVVWASEENIGGTLGADFDILYSSNSGAGWSAPVPVNSYATTDVDPDLSPRIVVSPNGKAHCVWNSDFDLVSGKSNIRYASRGAGGWSPAEYVNAAFAVPTQGQNVSPDLALDFSGVPHVVWFSDVNYNGAGADFDIFYSARTGGTWSAVQFINDAANDSAGDWDPSISRAPDGSLHVVWSADLNIQGAGTDRDLFYSKKTGSAWSVPKLLCVLGISDTGFDHEPRMLFDAEGDMHVAWRSSQDVFGSGTEGDILYIRISDLTNLPSLEPIYLANTSAFADGAAMDYMPCMAVDRNGRVHVGWTSFASLGGFIGNDLDVLHAGMDLPSKSTPGAPALESAWDNLNGSLHLGWLNYSKNPSQYLAFAWDIYTGQWVLGGWNNTLWHIYPYGAFQGNFTLTFSGGYHAWISNQYPNGAWFACTNPWTGVLYSGTPHTPLNTTATDLGGKSVRLKWKSELYGSWQYQITAWKNGTGWVNTTGPSGNNLWQFVNYPSTAFLNGQVNLTVPSAGDYKFYIRAAAWLSPYTPGQFAIASVHVN